MRRFFSTILFLLLVSVSNFPQAVIAQTESIIAREMGFAVLVNPIPTSLFRSLFEGQFKACGSYFVTTDDQEKKRSLIYLKTDSTPQIQIERPHFLSMEAVYVSIDSTRTRPSLTPFVTEDGKFFVLLLLTSEEYKKMPGCFPSPLPKPQVRVRGRLSLIFQGRAFMRDFFLA